MKKSDPLTSIGDFDLISSQNIAEIEENEWREVQDVEQIPFKYKERSTHNRNYSKLNIASAINLFFTDNFYTMAFKYTNKNIVRKNTTRKTPIKPIRISEIKKIYSNIVILRCISNTKR